MDFFNCIQQPFSLPLYQSRSLLKMKIDSSTCMTFSSLDIPLNKNDGMHICEDEWWNGSTTERVKKEGKESNQHPQLLQHLVVGSTNWVLNTSIVLPFLWWGRWQMWKSKRGQISGKHVRAPATEIDYRARQVQFSVIISVWEMQGTLKTQDFRRKYLHPQRKYFCELNVIF